MAKTVNLHDVEKPHLLLSVLRAQEQQIATLTRELNDLRARVAAGQIQRVPLTDVDYRAIRDTLEARGRFPINLTGLFGVDTEIPYGTTLPDPTTTPDSTFILIGTNTLNVLDRTKNPPEWIAVGNVPANMMTTDTNQTPDATVVKTWTARQPFNGGLDSGGQIHVTAGGIDVDAGGVNIDLGGLTVAAGDTEIGAELLLSGFASIDNTVSPYTVAAGVLLVAVDTSGGAVTVLLPATVKFFRVIIVVDVTGNASTNNITIDGNTNLISGGLTATVNVDYAGKWIMGTGSDYNIIGTIVP